MHHFSGWVGCPVHWGLSDLDFDGQFSVPVARMAVEAEVVAIWSLAQFEARRVGIGVFLVDVEKYQLGWFWFGRFGLKIGGDPWFTWFNQRFPGKPIWLWLRIIQEGLRRFWSMFPLTRVDFGTGFVSHSHLFSKHRYLPFSFFPKILLSNLNEPGGNGRFWRRMVEKNGESNPRVL